MVLPQFIKNIAANRIDGDELLYDFLNESIRTLKIPYRFANNSLYHVEEFINER
jgi:hypothetical protein